MHIFGTHYGLVVTSRTLDGGHLHTTLKIPKGLLTPLLAVAVLTSYPIDLQLIVRGVLVVKFLTCSFNELNPLREGK